MQNIKKEKKWQKQEEASVTVEASLVLPVFVFAVLFFLYFFQFLYLQDVVQSSMTEAGKFIARYGDMADAKEWSAVTKGILLKQKLYQELDKISIGEDYIIGGIEGISLITSEILEEESKIELVAMYRLQFPIPFWGEKTTLVTQKVKTRAFVGQAMKRVGGADTDTDDEELGVGELLVYVTENGRVYHTSTECTHLRLSISGIRAEEVENARNENGSRYKNCDKCVENHRLEETVYITREGECCHNSLSCSGLKRTVYTISYLEVAGMKKCTRCN